MTVHKLYQYLDERIPRTLSLEWDNDGLMCCPDGTREVRRVLVSLDVTDKVVELAIEGNYDVILSHHPLIFKGIKALNGEDPVSAKSFSLIRAGIAVMSFHTRLDAVHGGVNDLLCLLLGIADAEPFGENGETVGRIGTLAKETTALEFAKTVKEVLGAPAVSVADAGRAVRRVAVLGGSGGDDVAAARAAGADTYISGTLGYHDMTEAVSLGINLLEAGHFYTENPVCGVLRELVLGADETIVCDCHLESAIACV